MILNENDVYGAGGGNRTRFISLEGKSSNPIKFNCVGSLSETITKLCRWLVGNEFLERAAGIEPASLAWKAKVLPLHNARSVDSSTISYLYWRQAEPIERLSPADCTKEASGPIRTSTALPRCRGCSLHSGLSLRLSVQGLAPCADSLKVGAIIG